VTFCTRTGAIPVVPVVREGRIAKPEE